jgi:hypothetical protein
MSEKERLPPPRTVPLSGRDDVLVTVNRCPFCHDDVGAGDRSAVACRRCLARHHTACWNEAGHCSACRGTERLAPEIVRRRPRAFFALRLTIIALALVGLLTLSLIGYLVFLAPHGAFIEPAGSTPPVAAEASEYRARRVPIGRTVLVTDGRHYGAIVFERQAQFPEHAKFRYYLRREGRGTLDRRDPKVEWGRGETKEVSPTQLRVQFGPFDFQWSVATPGWGYVYAGKSARFHLTEEPPENVDPTHPSLVYHDDEGNPFTPPGDSR